ncbi:MAG: hypothetical protein KAH32_07265 [Chlamydiia bacterium]|nr:hypothetical protein [Chlamydiia bacterium]
MSILKNKKPKSTFSLKNALHKHLAGFEEARPIHNIHASAVTSKDKDFCPREYALLDLTGKKQKGQFIGTSLRTTFNHGNDLQKRINEEYLTKIMVGDWQCRNCGEIQQLCRKPEESKCFNQDTITHIWQYLEPRPLSKCSGISGGIDALINTGEPKYKIYELKTMAVDQFKALKAPLAEHRLRTNLYMRLVAESDGDLKHRVNAQEAGILYVCKGFGIKDDTLKEQGIKDAGFTPFKEFAITRDDKSTQELSNRAQMVKQFREGGKMPQGVCKNSFCKRAKTCPVISECFSGKYPPQLTWVGRKE